MKVSSAQYCVRAAAFALLLCAAPAAWAQSGDAAETVKELTRSIKSDSLSSSDIAEAFYQRGLAYRDLGQYANAIADFSSALWLGSLSGPDEEQAREQRVAAYQALGMRPQADARRASPETAAAPRSTASTTEPAAAGAFETRVESGDRPAPEQPRRQANYNPFGNHFDTAPQAPIPRPAVAQAAGPAGADEPAPNFRTSIVPEERSAEPETRAAPPERAETAQQETAADQNQGWTAAAQPTQPRSGSRIGRFFGSFLASDEEAEGQRAARAAPPAESWGASTSVATSSAEQGESAPATTGSVASAATGGRNYRVQLASVRTEEEAQAAWEQLASRHQDLIGGREPLIERSELGDLGTFYRVQLGPFSDRKEPLQLCNAFKRGGADCFLIAQ